MRRFIPYVSLCSILAAGCGGGGTVPSAGGDQNGSSGMVSYSYTRAGSALKPDVYSQNQGAVITGVAGANFTKIQVNPVKSLNATKIAASVHGQLWFVDVNSGIPTPIGPPNGWGSSCTPAWYPNGTLLALVRPDNGGIGQIFRINADGTGLKQLTTGSSQSYFPTWSPLGTKLAYEHFDGALYHIWTMNPDGTGATQLTSSTFFDVNPCFSADGSVIYFWHRNGAGTWDIASIPAGGGTSTTVYTTVLPNPGTLASSTLGQLAFTDSNGVLYMLSLGSGASASQYDYPSSGGFDERVTFSPDGQTCLWQQANSATSILLEKPSGFASGQPATQFGDTDHYYQDPAWGPFPGNRTLVGTGGALGATSAGFLLSQNRDVIGSFVSFSATTPATATITPESGSGFVSNAVFRVNADSITGLKYISDLYSQATTIIPGSFTTATGALVSFDSAGGKVTLVAPFSSSKRSVNKTGALAYTGHFLGVWNAAGKNLAPNGASSIEVDPMKGTLLHYN